MRRGDRSEREAALHDDLVVCHTILEALWHMSGPGTREREFARHALAETGGPAPWNDALMRRREGRQGALHPTAA